MKKKKKDISNEQKKGSFIFERLKFPFIFEELFHIYFVVLIIILDNFNHLSAVCPLCLVFKKQKEKILKILFFV